MRTLALLLFFCACAPTSHAPVGELRLAAADAPATPLVLDVRVIDASGAPVEGVRVRLEQDDGVVREHPEAVRLRGEVSSDARGGAVFYSVLPLGVVRVFVDGRGVVELVLDGEARGEQRAVALVQDEAGILYGSVVIEL